MARGEKGIGRAFEVREVLKDLVKDSLRELEERYKDAANFAGSCSGQKAVQF